MLNNVCIMGRITKDLEVKSTPGGTAVLSFSIAVERNYANANGDRETDFIDCVAWRQQAEFISRYFSKGRMIALTGELRKRIYEDKNGTKHYPTEVYVTSVSFTGEKREGNQSDMGNGYAQQASYNKNEGSMTNVQQPSNQGTVNISEFDDFNEFNEYDDGVPF